MVRKRPWWLIILIVLSVSGCVRANSQAGYGEKIRVLVLKGVRSLEVRGSDRGTLQIKREGYGSVKVNGRERNLPLRLSPQKEFVYLNNKPYRGNIEILDSKDGLLVVDELSLELYIVGIINNEISSKWPKDVIKTQAVIARTYALFQKNKKTKDPYHVEGTVMGQVYNGVDTEDSASLRAVRETSGEILTFSGEPALTVYHSNAGGMTDSSKDIWSHYYPYLLAVKSPYDETAPNLTWEYKISSANLKSLLNNAGYRIGEPESISIESLTGAGRVKSAAITDTDGKKIKISGEDLRKLVGYSNLKSTIFEVDRNGNAFAFKGKGAGHGVGLSQWGAKGMAEKGYNYKEILEHFYPGTDLTKAY